jgi:molybdopterin synthase catalytic subunit
MTDRILDRIHRIHVTEADFDSATLLESLRGRNVGVAGAVVTFTGYVRDFSSDDQTQTLYLEHYPGMCERELAEIGDESLRRWHVSDYVIAHRYGELPKGAQIVFVAIAGVHRGDAFRACEFIIDALKTRAPFWKRETLADGRQFWVGQREGDHDRAHRWSGESDIKEKS